MVGKVGWVEGPTAELGLDEGLGGEDVEGVGMEDVEEDGDSDGEGNGNWSVCILIVLVNRLTRLQS